MKIQILASHRKRRNQIMQKKPVCKIDPLKNKHVN